jgi:ATP-binding cassette, subfamily F, member 3
MISVNSIGLQFGGNVLFEDVSFRIGPRDRLGLVGSNGAGKTTLLRILVGQQLPDHGEVARARYVTVGYLAQEGMATAGRTLYTEVESVFGDIVQTQQRLDDVHVRMGEVQEGSEEYHELLDLAGELQHRLDISDAFRMKSAIEKVLMGLGFSLDDLARRTEEFSGGWQMRIALAKLLLQQPSLLLLDEPTNHLDLDSLRWLEDYLRGYDGAIMIVSHDRRFLDTMTSVTLELSLGTLTKYSGNFSAYAVAKEARREQQLAAYKNQQQQIRQTERFIERFRYKATKARQVQSRIKKLDKLDRIELEGEEGEITFAFPPAMPSGRSVIDLRNIRKRYGSLEVFDGVSLEIERGDRIAFVGVNGAGKSTLARIAAGVEPYDSGERRVGLNVTVAYFAQHQAEELDPSRDVLQTVDAIATGEVRKHLRTLLGCFLFSGDDVFKKVAVLSGGEKSRLALAKMLLQPANLIVLDEPTNHLDMRSKGILQEALASFEGSLVVVSHDRDFLDPLVTKVVEVRSGRLKTYLGNVSEYIASKDREAEVAAGETRNDRRADAPLSDKERKRVEAELRQRRYERTKPVKDALARLERTIEHAERRKEELEAMMADPEVYREGEKIREIREEHASVGKTLGDAYHQWGRLAEELEHLNDLTFADPRHRDTKKERP